jgi:hypothetical protein
MMDWGVVHNWINNLIMAGLGVAVLANPRWRRYIWFVCYALVGTAFAVLYMSFFFNHPFYLAKLIVTNLLALGAVVELVRKETGKEPLWAGPAILCLVTVPFLPIDWELRYTLAPIVLYFGQGLAISTAVKRRNILLTGMSAMGLAYGAGAVFKLFGETNAAWTALRYLDPWFFTTVVSLMLTGILMPQLVVGLKKTWEFIRSWNFNPHPLRPVEAEALSLGMPGSETENGGVYQFPSAARSSTKNHLSEGAALRFLMDELLERFDTMEEALAAAATISMSTRKTFLSRSDLAVYLGVSEEVAERFVEHRGITKLPLTNKGKEWVVSRESVDQALLEDSEE